MRDEMATKHRRRVLEFHAIRPIGQPRLVIKALKEAESGSNQLGSTAGPFDDSRPTKIGNFSINGLRNLWSRM